MPTLCMRGIRFFPSISLFSDQKRLQFQLRCRHHSLIHRRFVSIEASKSGKTHSDRFYKMDLPEFRISAGGRLQVVGTTTYNMQRQKTGWRKNDRLSSSEWPFHDHFKDSLSSSRNLCCAYKITEKHSTNKIKFQLFFSFFSFPWCLRDQLISEMCHLGQILRLGFVTNIFSIRLTEARTSGGFYQQALSKRGVLRVSIYCQWQSWSRNIRWISKLALSESEAVFGIRLSENQETMRTSWPKRQRFSGESG